MSLSVGCHGWRTCGVCFMTGASSEAAAVDHNASRLLESGVLQGDRSQLRMSFCR